MCSNSSDRTCYIHNIIDQAHTSTNSSGDLVASMCVAAMEGELDREVFNKPADI